MGRPRKHPLPKNAKSLVGTPCRLPLWLHKMITTEAERNRRSRNSEIIRLLESAVAERKLEAAAE